MLPACSLHASSFSYPRGALDAFQASLAGLRVPGLLGNASLYSVLFPPSAFEQRAAVIILLSQDIIALWMASPRGSLAERDVGCNVAQQWACHTQTQ